MKIQIASDLHLEHLERYFPGEKLIKLQPGVDVLVLAGDIHSGSKAIQMFDHMGVDVVMVAGNHEAYGRDWDATINEMKAASRGTRIHVLNNDEVVLGGVRFLGATLWTDFKVDGRSQEAQMRDVGFCLNDFRVITRKGKPFTTRDALAEHNKSRDWLESKLDQPFAGPTVVVTHHGPHPRSIHPRYAAERINGGFVSDLSPVLKKAQLWIHGHVHDSFEYVEHGCTVIANPHGYVRNKSYASKVEEFDRENRNFRDDRVVEVRSPG